MKGILILSSLLTLLFMMEAKHVIRKTKGIHQRIINGRRANMTNWPFIAYLNFHQPNPIWKTCGASLIANQFLVTAAHCVDEIPDDPQYLSIGFKRVERLERYEPGKNLSVSQIIVHPDYIHFSNISDYSLLRLDNDIALLKLSEPVNDPASIVELPSADADISSTVNPQCKGAGWGRVLPYPSSEAVHQTQYRHNASRYLMEITVSLVNKSKCLEEDENVHRPFFGDNLEKVICGGTLGSTESPYVCHGDSGSPLVCKGTHNQNVLQGIMVAGGPQCLPGRHYFYMVEISKYVSWIQSIITKKKE